METRSLTGLWQQISPGSSLPASTRSLRLADRILIPRKQDNYNMDFGTSF